MRIERRLEIAWRGASKQVSPPDGDRFKSPAYARVKRIALEKHMLTLSADLIIIGCVTGEGEIAIRWPLTGTRQ